MTLRPLTLVGIILSIVTGMAMGVALHVRFQEPPTPNSTLSDALRTVTDNYVNEISEEELLRHAIHGMMSGLDDHSDYLDPQSFDSLQATTTGQFGGIGIELGQVDGFFTVISPMDHTPADRAGLKSGDRITGVDGDSVRDMKMRTLIERLRGKPGSPVVLTIDREGDESKDYRLERAVIRVASVRGRLLEPDFGYIRISQFQVNTSQDLRDELESLEEENAGEIQGLVLDLRNNPGGTLQSSVEVADHFLDEGLIVYTQGRLKSSHAKFRATRGDLLGGKPIVVLINGGSASASEIVAASLKDHERATVMGTKSFGKGSVQTVLPLDDVQALKLTTAYYYTPDGHSIHGKGVEPQLSFEGGEEEMLDEAVQILKGQSIDEAMQARLNSDH